MASIGLATALLEERIEDLLGADGDDESTELIDSIKKNIEKAHDLITSLLSLAEIGLVPDNVESVDVGGVVGDVLEEHKAVLAEENIVVKVGDDLGHIIANPAQIHQIFANLIGNALEYARNEHTVIEISYLGGDENGNRRYLVRDNGPGIPENLMDRLFLPFVSQKIGGKGLGLAIVKAIVRTYGGRMRAYNDVNGACVEFSLRDLSPDT